MTVTLPRPDRVDDRTMVITGASSGVGRAAARALAQLGANVAVVGRNPDRTRQVADEIGAKAYLADFTDLGAVRALADDLLNDLPRIHVLANNAGGTFSTRTPTKDGFDVTFQSNHLSPFLLTTLLLPRMIETAKDSPEGSVRIVQTSSGGNLFGRVALDDLDNHRGPWMSGFRAYCTSKLENILFTRELARRLRGTDVSAYAFHPGFVASAFGGGSAAVELGQKLFAITPEEGAEPLVRLAAASGIPAPSGNYFDRLSAPGRTTAQANDARLAAELWAGSELRVGVRADLPRKKH